MRFYADNLPQNPLEGDVVLFHSNWDDWFDYETLFRVERFDSSLNREEVGYVKIGAKNIVKKRQGGDGAPDLPSFFERLSDIFFSLGQDAAYYNKISDFGDKVRSEFLGGMNDIAYNKEMFEKIKGLDVFKISLIRSVPVRVVTSEYRAIANGQSALSEYLFFYKSALSAEKNGSRYELDFAVVPNSIPPTNIHIIIGRNGVGKTHLISNMVKSLTQEEPRMNRVGKFIYQSDDELFSNLVSVSFSAFDNLDLNQILNDSNVVRYQYIGLRKMDKKSIVTKTSKNLTKEFWNYFSQCMNTGRRERWIEIVSMLNSDPIFEGINVVELVDAYMQENGEKLCKDFFKNLSSGHSIVLLTITGLVATVEQKTLVLIDEPEAHLHPPLLSAFIRALSQLVYAKNGVAIIATHSPVVLQEVPRNCVWRLDRRNKSVKADRLNIETFGGNIGTLTREVFGYEVTNSGFHLLLKKISEESDSFEEAVLKYGDSLGDEALGILRTMMYHKDDEIWS